MTAVDVSSNGRAQERCGRDERRLMRDLAEPLRAGRPQVVVVGAGAAGTLVALHLTRTAVLRSTGLEVVLLDPAERWGRGVSFGTVDDQHLLDVPASGMSALPQDPGHFVSWRRRSDARQHGGCGMLTGGFGCGAGADPARLAGRTTVTRRMWWGVRR